MRHFNKAGRDIEEKCSSRKKGGTMGKKDVISKIYLGAADRIADLLNNELFEGGSAVAASDIIELDSEAASILKDEDNIVNVRVVAKDLVRKVQFGIQVMLFAIEEQSDIHYAMPLKVLNGDAALYDKQWSGIRREHKRKKDLSGTEYISGFGREDHLVPVLSVVLYFGEQEWDGPLCLKEMMDLSTLPEEVREKIADYPVHLIDVRRYPHAERFRTDLKLVFGFLQRASEPEELTEFIEENTKEFSSLTEDAYDMIASMSETWELKELKKDVEQTEDYDMCKAIDMMMQEREERGIKLGEARGIQLGEARGIKLGEERGEARGIETDRNIFRLYKKGYKQNEIAEALKISLERVKEFLEE